MGTIIRPLVVETGKSDEGGINIDMETLIFLKLINGEIMREITRSKPVVVADIREGLNKYEMEEFLRFLTSLPEPVGIVIVTGP